MQKIELSRGQFFWLNLKNMIYEMSPHRAIRSGFRAPHLSSIYTPSFYPVFFHFVWDEGFKGIQFEIPYHQVPCVLYKNTLHFRRYNFSHC